MDNRLNYYNPSLIEKSTAHLTADICVYGGNAAGVIAAVQARRMGKTAIVLEPSDHLGGLTSGGLGHTDIGNRSAIGGLSLDFYRRVGAYYEASLGEETFKRIINQPAQRDPISKRWLAPKFQYVDGKPEAWDFEPHVAGRIFDDLCKQHDIPVRRRQYLQSVEMDGPTIRSIILEGGLRVSAKVFVDASYEGDLMAKARVPYTVGREPNSKYNETINGVQVHAKHQFDVPVDPHVVAGKPESGLLPYVNPGPVAPTGSGDHRVQAYNFRMCLTDNTANRIAFPKPAGYDPKQYELLARCLQAGWNEVFYKFDRIPNQKTDTNNHGAVSTDFIGANYAWPDADYANREKLFQAHVNYQMGLQWFLANDDRVPSVIRNEYARWGLCKDEFVMTGGWPHQLYIREARRMLSDYVMTENNVLGRVVADDPVGMGSYGMDSHNCQRFVDDKGHARNEGDVQIGGFAPYGISYRSIVPPRGSCSNLIVPVCASASHIAYGSIRMEPVFMALGQSAATAGAMCIDRKVAVQDLPYPALREQLLKDEAVLPVK